MDRHGDLYGLDGFDYHLIIHVASSFALPLSSLVVHFSEFVVWKDVHSSKCVVRTDARSCCMFLRMDAHSI